MMNEHFNKNLTISAGGEAIFQLCNKCWICNKYFTQQIIK